MNCRNHIAFLLLAVLFTSCAINYVRYSNLHHTSSYRTSLKLINRSSGKLKFKTKGTSELNNQVYEFVECQKRDEAKENKSCLIFLEDNKVIYFHGSYWVANDAPDSLIQKYTNPDVNF